MRFAVLHRLLGDGARGSMRRVRRSVAYVSVVGAVPAARTRFGRVERCSTILQALASFYGLQTICPTRLRQVPRCVGVANCCLRSGRLGGGRPRFPHRDIVDAMMRSWQR